MPPPFNTSLVLSRLVQADFPTSVVTTLVCHFSGLLVSPVLLHIMVKILNYYFNIFLNQMTILSIL